VTPCRQIRAIPLNSRAIRHLLDRIWQEMAVTESVFTLPYSIQWQGYVASATAARLA
jgi:hypothetical protein